MAAVPGMSAPAAEGAAHRLGYCVVASGTEREQTLALAHRIAAKSSHVVKSEATVLLTGRSTWT
jgi:hypothetical protein